MSRNFGAEIGCQPEHARTIAVLRQVDAGLGQKDLVSRSQTPIDLMADSKDNLRGALVLRSRPGLHLDGDRDRVPAGAETRIELAILTMAVEITPLWPAPRQPRLIES